MKFIISESAWDFLERLTYRGAIGIFYETTLGGLFAYLIFGITIILATIGLCTVIKWIIVKTTAPKPYGYRKHKSKLFP